jgi:hypothetical protein
MLNIIGGILIGRVLGIFLALMVSAVCWSVSAVVRGVSVVVAKLAHK